MRLFGFALCAGLLLAGATRAEQVGEVGVDWVGNDIEIEALHDPEIEGVTCHIAYFDRSVIDRLSNGNWFEDPSNSSIACKTFIKSPAVAIAIPGRIYLSNHAPLQCRRQIELEPKQVWH